MRLKRREAGVEARSSHLPFGPNLKLIVLFANACHVMRSPLASATRGRRARCPEGSYGFGTEFASEPASWSRSSSMNRPTRVRSRASAMRFAVLIETLRLPRSMLLRYVGCTPTLRANPSCEYPFARRKRCTSAPSLSSSSSWPMKAKPRAGWLSVH